MQQERRISAVRAAILALMCVVPWVASGCGSAGDDAVAQGGTFQFVSPGGQTVITYDPQSTGARSYTDAATEIARRGAEQKDNA